MPVKSVAYFISSHGFGHAARAAAVMQAIAEYDPSVQLEIFTATPSWFFQDSLSTPFNYHHLLTDFGLAQKTPFQIRQRLGLLTDRNVVLITTGGIPQSYDFLQKLNKLREIKFVMPGAGPEIKIRDNLIILPHQSDFYHPDLANACDAVVGKVGYSTLAEVYHAGVPFGYVARSNYNESGPMVNFIKQQMSGIALEESEFQDGEWVSKIRELLALPRVHHKGANGAV